MSPENLNIQTDPNEQNKIKIKDDKKAYILKFTKMIGKFLYDSKRKVILGRQPLDWSIFSKQYKRVVRF